MRPEKIYWQAQKNQAQAKKAATPRQQVQSTCGNGYTSIFKDGTWSRKKSGAMAAPEVLKA
jgi:hypothetical protein